MIDATIDPKILGHIIKAVETVMTEIHLRFDPDGMKVEQMSSDKSCMIGAIVPKSEFIEYTATAEHLIILNMERVSKIGKRLSKAEAVGLSFDEDGPDSNLFQMVLTGEDNRRVFNLVVFAPDKDYKKVTVPFDIEFESEFQMTGEAFDSVIKDLLIMAVRAKFLVESDRVVFRGGTTEGSETKIIYNEGKELSGLTKGTGDKPLSAQFSLSPLEDLSGAIADKKSAITIKMSHDKPLWFEIDIAEDENSQSRLVALLSPVLDRRKS